MISFRLKFLSICRFPAGFRLNEVFSYRFSQKGFIFVRSSTSIHFSNILLYFFESGSFHVLFSMSIIAVYVKSIIFYQFADGFFFTKSFLFLICLHLSYFYLGFIRFVSFFAEFVCSGSKFL